MCYSQKVTPELTMNGIEKGESIRTGLRKGFQGGTSKIAQRRCCGYNIGLGGKLTINPDEAAGGCVLYSCLYNT